MIIGFGRAYATCGGSMHFSAFGHSQVVRVWQGSMVQLVNGVTAPLCCQNSIFALMGFQKWLYYDKTPMTLNLLYKFKLNSPGWNIFLLLFIDFVLFIWYAWENSSCSVHFHRSLSIKGYILPVSLSQHLDSCKSDFSVCTLLSGNVILIIVDP